MYISIKLLCSLQEERFLFPIYPLLALFGAVSIDYLQVYAYKIILVILICSEFIHVLHNYFCWIICINTDFRSCVVCWCLDRGANTTQPTPTGSPSVCVSCLVPSHSLVLLPCIRVSNSVCVWYKVSSSPVALLFLRVNNSVSHIYALISSNSTCIALY